MVLTDSISANNLIISDIDVKEKIIRDDFTYRYIDSIFMNTDKLYALMDRLEEQVYVPPINASLDDSWTIVPEKHGYTLDREGFIRFFYQFFYSDVSFEMKVPKRKIYPKVDSELLSDIRSKEIGNYITYYRKSNKERSHNIYLAAEAINNTVVFPGEEFSFNKVVGKRTVEKGYKRAPVIVRGELSEDIGGGICQVSSTLFNAVNLEGIRIVERYSHSRKVPYVPPGKDATVSWWGPDFIFKNEYSHPILIRAKAIDGKMVIRIFSSEEVKIN
ncbi:VanW family protein [Ornithinibacillus sp. BX22]|uniref:VanW family protein n=3 Tax=Bacillaceae TaxID=186817 RepID=A0A923L3G8_9BACI|nr:MULTISPECIES: VanW family protein [Ornithinibacillus]MBC5635772.1 VanW family protein [Ornithinibacillus hominis]MBS3680239.1 VanW family protein [Ornithinibacillus massiliensis]